MNRQQKIKSNTVFISILYFIFSIVIVAMVTWNVEQNEKNKLQQQLNLVINAENKAVTDHLQKLKNDTLWLSKALPIQGIVQASINQEVEANAQQNLAEWKERLDSIFATFISSNLMINQVRVIGVADAGRELVRLDRRNSNIIKVTEDQLQQKARRDYFKAIQKLKEGELFVSDITLNQENGKIAEPITPVIRVGTPIYTESGAFFGALIINADAMALFKSITNKVVSHYDLTETFIVNSEGDYLKHSQPDLAFGFEFGTPYRWSDDFELIGGNKYRAINKALFSDSTNYFIETTDVFLEEGELARKLKILVIAPESLLLKEAYLWAFYVLIILVIIYLVFLYTKFHSKSKVQQQHIAEILEIQKRLNLVVEASPHGNMIIDSQGKIELVNAQVEKIFGYHRDELIGQTMELLLPKRFKAQHPQLRTNYFISPEAKIMGAGRDLFGLRKDGIEFPLEVGLNPIEFDGEKKVLCGIIDISERKNLQQQFELVVESSPNAMIMVNSDGVIELVNSEAEHQFGYSRSELLGDVVEKLIPKRYRDHHPEMVSAYFLNSGTRAMGADRELYGLRKNGTEFPVEIGIRPIETLSGKKVLASIIDISERKHFTDELKRSNKELDNFAYVASHDLKSPLRGIDQLATWLTEDLEGKIDDQAQEHLQLIRSRIDRMERLLDDLLAYSRAGKKDSNIKRTDTKELIQSVFDLANTTGSFDLNYKSDFSEIECAVVPLEQVFRNLITNAIKHHDTQQGVITVECSETKSHYIFVVADDGLGIPRDHAELAFQMFQTLRPRDEVEGSGMGLAIVKKIVELFGGTIQLSENQPRGARFTFSWSKSQ